MPPARGLMAMTPQWQAMELVEKQRPATNRKSEFAQKLDSRQTDDAASSDNPRLVQSAFHHCPTLKDIACLHQSDVNEYAVIKNPPFVRLASTSNLQVIRTVTRVLSGASRGQHCDPPWRDHAPWAAPRGGISTGDIFK